MSQLDRLEQLAQRLVEGTFNRFFQSQGAPTEPLPQSGGQTQTKEVLSIAAGMQRAGRWALQLNDRRLSLGEPVINLGRALDNDVILDDPTVSRYHAQLRWRQGEYMLYPPDPSLRETNSVSRPHTLVNQVSAAAEPQPLAHADVLQLGQTTITVLIDTVSPL
jgi:pSer/pThr/pTyr-binding forkhead associated (FHA) protein